MRRWRSDRRGSPAARPSLATRPEGSGARSRPGATVRVGINGFGRIGRSFYRAILARGDAAQVELVAVNDPFGDADTMAFLLKHDSVGGTIRNEVKAGVNGLLNPP